MKFSLSSYKIDWPNHIVGFFSALFGILIAFQLEEWRDQREREQLVQLALQNLKSEIDINKNYYEETMRFNETFLHFLLESSPNISEELTFRGSPTAIDSLNKFFPAHFLIGQASGKSSRAFPIKITLNIS